MRTSQAPLRSLRGAEVLHAALFETSGSASTVSCTCSCVCTWRYVPQWPGAAGGLAIGHIPDEVAGTGMHAGSSRSTVVEVPHRPPYPHPRPPSRRPCPPTYRIKHHTHPLHSAPVGRVSICKAIPGSRASRAGLQQAVAKRTPTRPSGHHPAGTAACMWEPPAQAVAAAATSAGGAHGDGQRRYGFQGVL